MSKLKLSRYMHALLCLSGIPLMRNEANAYFEKRFYSVFNDKGMNKDHLIYWSMWHLKHCLLKQNKTAILIIDFILYYVFCCIPVYCNTYVVIRMIN